MARGSTRERGIRLYTAHQSGDHGDDIIATHVARLRHAQPICEPGFAAKIPPIQTPIESLQIADTCFYYPEDRGISESVRIACEMAADGSRQHERAPPISPPFCRR